jgi:hypothetical protein
MLSLKWVVNRAISNYLKLILVDVVMFFGDLTLKNNDIKVGNFWG